MHSLATWSWATWSLATAAFLLSLGPSGAAEVDAQKLTAEMAGRISRAAPRIKVTIEGPLTLKISGGPGGDGQINLDRIAAFCAENPPADCEAEKAKFVTAAAESATTDYAVTRANLRVVVRSTDYARAMQETVGSDKKLVTRPIGDGLVAMLGADFPNTISMVAAGDLKSLGLTETEAFELGRRNVLAHLPSLPTAAELQRKLISFAGEDYDASLLLADGWGDLARRTGGKLFIVVSSDNQVLVGLADDEQIRRLRALAEQDFRAADRPISPHVYRWSAEGWRATP